MLEVIAKGRSIEPHHGPLLFVHAPGTEPGVATSISWSFHRARLPRPRFELSRSQEGAEFQATSSLFDR